MHTRSKVVAVVTLCSLFTSAWLFAERPAKPLTEVTISASRVDWLPLVDYERLFLTVAGPNDLYIRQEFEVGQSPSLGLFSSNGNPLPDGNYTYEFGIVQRQKGEGSRVPLRQSGYLAVRGGSFVVSETPPPAKAPTPTPLKRITAEEIIPEGACIGEACTTGEEGFPLRLHSEALILTFDDSGTCCTSQHDWSLQANDFFTGAGEYFSIVDGETGFKPFTVEGDAPDASLYVRSNGNVGIGTATPGALLHIHGTATSDAFASMGPNPASGPALNFGYGGGSFGRGAGFFNVRPDASATAPNPSLRFLTANVERMILTNTGKVGIGTSSPTEKLHVFENVDANTLAMVENSNTGTSAAAFLRTKSDNGFTQISTHSSGRTITRFGQTLAGRGEILHADGNGLLIGTLQADDLILGTNNANRLQINGSTGAVTISGNLTVNGTFSNPSSRALKEEFKSIDPKTVLDKFARLPIQEWSYKSDVRKLRHVGPTVEDFQASFGLGTEGQHIFPMDVQGVTMTAVQGLYQLVQEKDAEIAALRERLAALEELVSKLAPQ